MSAIDTLLSGGRLTGTARDGSEVCAYRTPQGRWYLDTSDRRLSVDTARGLLIFFERLTGRDEPCMSCGRPTFEAPDSDNPLRRCWQGVDHVYVLCARCEAVAREEVPHADPR